MLGPMEQRRAWMCPSGLLHNGWNIVRITVEKAGGERHPGMVGSSHRLTNSAFGVRTTRHNSG